MSLISLEKISKRFVQEQKTLTVLDRVDLNIAKGDMACIVGPSGAGKSTLLHIAGTLDRPTEGIIRYDETDISKLSNRALAQFRNEQIGFVFQFHHLLPEFSALENVMMPGHIGRFGRTKLKTRAKELLDRVGLKERMHHRPSELSGGEQQRVALARALVMNPRVVLADEPTGNLDSATSDAIHDLLFTLNREENITFLIVTHSRELAERMPRVISMRDGQIESDEQTESDTLSPHQATPASNQHPASTPQEEQQNL